MPKILLINSNSIRIPLAAESVHCVVTSPPYWGLRDYGVPGQLGLEPTPEEYVANMVQVFREVWRVLRKDGTVWLNLGDSYSQGGGKQVLQTKNASHGLEGMRAQTPNLPAKQLLGIPWRVALALQADGWWLRSDIIWHKPNCMPESVQDRPTTSHEYLFLLAKSKQYFYDADAVREEAKYGRRDWSDVEGVLASATTAYDSRSNHGIRVKSSVTGGDPSAGRNRRTVWTIPTKPYSGAHFATFPPALVEPCIKAGTSERGVCPECGAQWERVISKPKPPPEVFTKRNAPTDELICSGSRIDGKMVGHGQKLQDWLNANPTKTIGWRSACNCSGLTIIGDQPQKPSKKPGETKIEFAARLTLWQVRLNKWWQHWSDLKPLYDAEPTIPATVLDPFTGSGTTNLAARQLGRRSIGLDLSFAYLRDQARTRLELDKLEAWESGRDGEGEPLEGLPLFGRLDK